jgi:hypothetical protein
MNCTEVQDRLWESDDGADLHAHVAACAECAAVPDEIARIRGALRGPAPSPARTAAGVIARIAARPRRPAGLLRIAGALVIGATLALFAAPRREVERIVHAPPPAPGPLQGLVAGIEKDPVFEELFLEVLNETLRRRSALAVAPRPVEDKP